MKNLFFLLKILAFLSYSIFHTIAFYSGQGFLKLGDGEIWVDYTDLVGVTPLQQTA